MSNSGKVWDIREAYKQIRKNAWSRGDIGIGSIENGGIVNKVQISTTGNATAFGNLTVSDNSKGAAAGGSATRLLYSGGNQPTTSNVICFKEFSSDGNFADFGDLSVDRQMHTGASNSLRTVFAGGRQNPGSSYTTSNRMDVSTFASLGNAVDFGDLTVARIGSSAMQSPTRAVFGGGGNPSNVIDFVTWSSLGNAADFGDIGTSTTYNYFGGSSSETRGVFGGGGDPSNTSIINFVTMASTGNSQDFGDLTQNRITMSAASNSNRVCFFAGQQNDASGSATNVIDFVTIATTGDATDFGDMTTDGGFKTGGHSNGHGGLALGDIQRPSVTYMPGSGRVFFTGGSPDVNTIDTVNVNVLGNSSDFGDLSVGRRGAAGYSSLTRGMSGGGFDPSASNVIDSFEMASRGNAADFGDLTVARLSSGASNQTRGLHMGGGTPTRGNVIDYVTIASTGNATDFGDTTINISQGGAAASPTRAVRGGGTSPSTTNVIDYVTIGSTGNATDFGDLTQARSSTARGSCNTNIRGLFASGYANPADVKTIDYITIASTGNAIDFGDTATAGSAQFAQGDSHGGLQSS